MNINSYEAKLKQINEKYQKGSLSREEVQVAIADLLGQDNLAYRLKEDLEKAVNGEISFKAKERLDDRAYFLKRNEIENSIIASDFPFAFFNSDSCTAKEIEALDIGVINKKTLMLIIIEALKGYVDNESNNPKAEVLHGLYLRLKQELSSEIPFEAGDGYLNYVGLKGQRAELELTRETGSVCPYCLSHNIIKNGNAWQCKNCKKYWRKK